MATETLEPHLVEALRTSAWEVLETMVFMTPSSVDPIEEGKTSFSDEVIGVLTSETKKRREAATAFADGGRAESAERERAEAEVIAEYLPEQLSEEEVAEIVTAAIESTGASAEGMKAMGKVMGVVQPQVKGRADGGAVAAEVRRQLGA